LSERLKAVTGLCADKEEPWVSGPLFGSVCGFDHECSPIDVFIVKQIGKTETPWIGRQLLKDVSCAPLKVIQRGLGPEFRTDVVL